MLLFDGVVDDELRWLLFDDGAARVMTSPLTAYIKLAARTQGRPGPRELRIDRAWAIEATRTMIAAANGSAWRPGKRS